MNIRSLRTKFMLLFFTFFFLPFGLLTLFSVSKSKSMVQRSTAEHLQNLVEVKETAIEQWVKERILDGKSLAESQEIKSLDPRRIEPLLSLVRHFERPSLEIGIVDLKGGVVSGNPSKGSFENEEWFQRAIAEGTFVSGPSLQPPSLQPAITISFSIKGARGRPIGVLREFVHLTYVSELISESKLGDTGELFIANLQGKISLHKRLRELLKTERATVPYFETFRFESVYTGVYRGYTGNEVLGSWKWIPSLRCYLIAEQDTKEAFYEIDLLVKRAFIIFVFSTLLILGISYGVIGRVTNPIKGLSERVASFAYGDFGKTVTTKRGDEIGKLIVGFNVMAEKLKKAYTELEGKVEASNKELETAYQILKKRQEQLVQSEKMAALGQLSAGIAHEIRTPLTSIKIFIQSLGKEMNLDENQEEDFRIILREIDRINENITRFLNFARPEDPQFQVISINALVKDSVNLLAPKLKNCGIRVELALRDKEPLMQGDPKQLAQVFLNLLLNAIEAMPGGGTLMIRSTVEANRDTDQDFFQLVIQDTGYGITEKDRPYIFDPFFTTKAGGTGLGLSIVYSIIQTHKGKIEVESESGKGSSFVLSFPIQEEKGWRGFSS